MPRPVTFLKYQTRRRMVEQVRTCYRQVSLAQKTLLLKTVVAVTGSAYTYAIQLLNEASEGKRRIQRRPVPLSLYGPEILQALLVVWKAARHIYTKRLIPFLPTLVEALERHGHLHLSEESRISLLQNAPPADHLLRSHRRSDPRGLSTTQTGHLLT